MSFLLAFGGLTAKIREANLGDPPPAEIQHKGLVVARQEVEN
jgi:hypothetical protein